MSLANKIYYHAPYFIKVLILNIKAFILYRNRYSGNFKHMLEQHKKLWQSDFYTIRLFQQSVLREMLLECHDHSNWYRSVMEEKGITMDDIRSDPEATLFRMPPLTKQQRRELAGDIMISEVKRPTAASRTTSGTTGTPMTIKMDKDTQQRTFAYLYRYYWSIGLPYKFRCARFTGNNIVSTDQKKPPFWVQNYLERQLFMSSYHLSDENLKHYVRKLNRFKPHLLDGYPSTIFILARYILSKNIKLSFKPVAISVTAETLYDEQRKAIEKAFQAKVYNQYASAEGSPIITECREGNLHMHLDTGYFEYRERGIGGPAAPPAHGDAAGQSGNSHSSMLKGHHGMTSQNGNAGDSAVSGSNATSVNNDKFSRARLAELVVTGFRNRKMPLIRYEIGDYIEINELETCTCGCRMPLVRQIVGREDDFFVHEHGGLIGRVASVLFKNVNRVRRGQIIQKKLSQFEIIVEAEEGFGKKDQKVLVDRTREIMGATAQVSIKVVDQIPAGAGGKLRAAIREFPLEMARELDA